MKRLALLLALTLAACTSTQRQVTRSLADLGLAAAVASGKLSPGDSLTIGNGVAILTSEGETKTKAIQLAALGLTAAAERGLIKPGDAVLIQEATAIITTAVSQPEPPLPTVLVTSPAK